jgi:hypothetical protein
MGTAELKAELAEVGIERFTARDYKPGRVTHIVLFRYSEDVPAETVQEAADRFVALAGDLRHDGRPYITSIDAGAQNSGEGAEAGFQHAFVVTFESLGDRNYYVGEPVFSDDGYLDRDHAAFKQFVGPLLAGGLVFDFTVGEF